MPDKNADDALAGIPDALRFELADRSETDRVPFALGETRLLAARPKEYTMLALAGAMSGMADGTDIAYAVMLFCHDSFDGPTRSMVSNLEPDDLYLLIQKLCDHWGQDTSGWQTGKNRSSRRATAPKKQRSRR